jgi:[protein-PII] uridylyltransferase
VGGRAAGYGKTWDELARSGLATPFEASQIKRNEALLCLIRAACTCWPAGAKTGWCSTCRPPWPNRLATPPKWRPTAASCARQRGTDARYYWAAKAVTQLNQILLLNIEERLRPPHRAAPASTRASSTRPA